MAHENPEPTGDGGNSTITNQDEQTILDRVPQIPVRTEGMQEPGRH
jgi:hypothetical protein